MWTVILNSVKSFLGKFFKSALQQQLQILMPVALGIVSAIENDPSIVVNGDKRSVAFDAISDKVRAGEKGIGASLINLAIELAVQEIKLMGK